MKLSLFVIQTESGKYYKTLDKDAFGCPWVDDIINARVYTRKASAEHVMKRYRNTAGEPLKLIELKVSASREVKALPIPISR